MAFSKRRPSYGTHRLRIPHSLRRRRVGVTIRTAFARAAACSLDRGTPGPRRARRAGRLPSSKRCPRALGSTSASGRRRPTFPPPDEPRAAATARPANPFLQGRVANHPRSSSRQPWPHLRLALPRVKSLMSRRRQKTSRHRLDSEPLCLDCWLGEALTLSTSGTECGDPRAGQRRASNGRQRPVAASPRNTMHVLVAKATSEPFSSSISHSRNGMVRPRFLTCARAMSRPFQMGLR